MSDLERLKERIVEKYFTEEVNIDSEVYRKLSDKEKEKYTQTGEFTYCAKLDIPPDEIDSFLALKSFEAQMETKNAIVTIKNIVVFIFVLSIIASIVLFFLQTQRF